MPQFMVHDRWANALFLHWRVPPDLEPVLQNDCGPFPLDRTLDGSAWIGFILLTEQNVGLPYAWMRPPCVSVTHHGANIRTYVRGGGRDTASFPKGIHFSSLECDDRFTAFGANWFGMPYRVANISRWYGYNSSSNSNELAEDTAWNWLSVRERDDCVCVPEDTGQSRCVQKYRFASTRVPQESSSCLARLLGLLRSLLFQRSPSLHHTELQAIGKRDTNNERGEFSAKKDDEGSPRSFSIECAWERLPASHHHTTGTNIVSADLARFFVERYSVYTQAYGLRWRGDVSHAPWPVEPVVVTQLSLRGVDSYEPESMRPLLRYMASCRPDSVLFSEGVGPIAFEMLRPIGC